MGFSLNSLKNIVSKRHTDERHAPVETLPTDIDILDKQSTEALEKAEYTETSELHKRFQELQSQLDALCSRLEKLLIGRLDVQSEYYANIMRDSKAAFDLFSGIYEESVHIQSMTVVLKRKLMQKHELYADTELLRLQNEAFTMLSNAKEYLSRVDEILSFSFVTLQEIKNDNTAVRSNIVNAKEQIEEIISQIKQAVVIIQGVVDHLQTLEKIEGEIKGVVLGEQVHKAITLEEKDVRKLAAIYEQTFTVFKDASQKYNVSLQKDTFLPYIECLEHRVLPILQKCMKYEHALFHAAVCLDNEKQSEDVVSDNIRQTYGTQSSLRLFLSTMRAIYKEINTDILQRLAFANKSINQLLVKNTSSLTELSVQTKNKQLDYALSDGKECISEVLQKLLALKSATYQLSVSLESLESEHS